MEVAFAPEDLEKLRRAVLLLERSSLTGRVSELLGQPFDKLLLRLPQPTVDRIVHITQRALEQALETALKTLSDGESFLATPAFHKLASGLSGAIGGSLGLIGLALELPMTLTLMVRAIAATARRHGEDPRNPEVKLHCLLVFALGEPAERRSHGRSGYYAVRFLLSKSLRRAVREMVQQEALKKGSPFLVHFLQQVAASFGLHLSRRVALQTLPAVSALTSAAINVAFMNFYCDLAEAHFTVRELERKYGTEAVERLYHQLLAEEIAREQGAPLPVRS